MGVPARESGPVAQGDGERIAVRLHAPVPECMEIGLGQFLVVSGECAAPGEAITGVRVGAGGNEEAAELSPTLDGVAFWHALFLDPERAGQTLPVHLTVSFRDGPVAHVELGETACIEDSREPASIPAEPEDGELIAICLASYDPDLEAFARQADSIRAQNHRNWICIVNDDGTPETKWREMQRRYAQDPRFVFAQNSRNLGFYGNFERVLGRVPPAARYVAFADQDDFWYPDKLSRLLQALRESDADLVYSDMRIVDTDGREVAPTYWVNRRNEFRDLPVVMVANTVTGASSLFKSELLDRLLPFPPRVGDAFHDHWIACTVMSSGRIAYVDEPLYDYYQYGDSVIGHCDFTRFSIAQRVVSLIRFTWRLCRPSVAAPLLKGKYASALAVYRGECRRLRILGETIKRRSGVTGRPRRQLSLCSGGPASLFRLLALHFKVLAKGQTTDDAELRLAMGELARIIEKRRVARKHAAH